MSANGFKINKNDTFVHVGNIYICKYQNLLILYFYVPYIGLFNDVHQSLRLVLNKEVFLVWICLNAL